MNGAKYRQRPSRLAVGLISVPAAFGLAILVTMTMLGFDNLSSRAFNPFASAGSTSPSQTILTVAVPLHSTSTPETSAAKEPHIKVGSTQADIAQLRLLICGFHFDSAHKATLVIYVPDKKLLWLRDTPVDKDGELRVQWTIPDCSHVPNFIYAYEVTSSKPIKVELQIVSFGSCSIPTTTPKVKSPGYLRKFGN